MTQEEIDNLKINDIICDTAINNTLWKVEDIFLDALAPFVKLRAKYVVGIQDLKDLLGSRMKLVAKAQETVDLI